MSINNKEGVSQPSIQLPGLEGRVLPGGTEIYARPGELDFVARIVGIGIRLDQAQQIVEEQGAIRRKGV